MGDAGENKFIAPREGRFAVKQKRFGSVDILVTTMKMRDSISVEIAVCYEPKAIIATVHMLLFLTDVRICSKRYTMPGVNYRYLFRRPKVQTLNGSWKATDMASAMVVVVTHVTEVQQAFASALSPCGLAPILASTVQEALAILSRHPISLVFCSDDLPADGPEILIRQLSLKARRHVPVVVVSRLDDWERYLDFLSYGAFDYVLYPLTPSEIQRVVRNARNFRNLSIVEGAAHGEGLREFSQLHLN
jgi:CheY-like chemotaxis protein